MLRRGKEDEPIQFNQESGRKELTSEERDELYDQSLEYLHEWLIDLEGREETPLNIQVKQDLLDFFELFAPDFLENDDPSNH